jgi:dinuclear metal center YbgI/SA1388 family protein
MTVRDFHDILMQWAPRELAWERDNPGLQCGSFDQRVTGICVTLDVTDAVIAEARRRNANLIISHHPLLFRPLTSVDENERAGRLLAALLRARIALYSVHTNLDFTTDGVSAALAAKLGLEETEVLHQDQRVLEKIVVFTPHDAADKVRSAMAHAGAGTIGDYESCSFQVAGTGMFRPLSGANPHIGTVGSLERVGETRIEMIAPKWSMAGVVSAMRAVHPYEEVAYDVIALQNPSPRHGAGIIGNLPSPLAASKFFALVKKQLSVPVLRHTATSPAFPVRRVAVCGGSGSDLLPVAVRRGADVLVTGDVSYHRFEEAEGRILLIDAGHFETEVHILQPVARRLSGSAGIKGSRIRVFTAQTKRNPVHYHLS